MTTTDKILRWVVLVGLFAIPLSVPFVVSSSMFFPFITGKNFLFRIITEIVFATWLILALRNRSYRPKFSWVAASVGAFIAVLVVADFLAENPHKAFWSNYERMEGFVSMVHLALFFIVAGSVLITEKIWSWFWHAPMTVAIAMFFYGMLQLKGELVINQGGVRLDGTLGNATYLAGFLVFNIFLALIFWSRKHMDRLNLILSSWAVGSGIFIAYHVFPYIRRSIEAAKAGVAGADLPFFYGQTSKTFFLIASMILVSAICVIFFSRKWGIRTKHVTAEILYFLTAVALFYPLYNTATRGAMIGLFGGLLLTALIIIIWGKETPGLRKSAAVLAVILVTLSGALWLARDSDFVKNNPTLSRLTSIDWNDADANARKQVWNMAWQGVKERPVVGWGQEGFNHVFNKYYDPKMYLREQWFDRTHNIIFDWLIAAGILGLLAYLSMLASAVLYIADMTPRFMRSKMAEPAHKFAVLEKALFVGMLAAYFFQVFFVFDNIVSYIMLFALLAYLHARSAVPYQKLEKAEVVTNADAARFYAPIMIVILVAAIWFVNVRSIFASQDLIKALGRQADPTVNYNYFKSALDRGGFANQEIREQIIQVAANLYLASDQVVPPATKSVFVGFASAEMEQQAKESPTDARIRVFLGSFYSITNNLQGAVTELEEALKLSPNKQVIKASLANIYLRMGNMAKAVQLMKSAYESAPEFADIRNGYAVAAIYAGQGDVVSELLTKFIVFGPIDGRIIQALTDSKNTEQALTVAKTSYEKYPSDINAAINLARVHLQRGSRNTAIAILRDFGDQNPGAKTKTDEFIAEIQKAQ
ncbi:MAG: O-antigen ligase family protein [Candidatus Taylorbacteria bacterium]|nr:O-antigen ligase family protein [Candidatus Taylorbacteria bacterium]